MLRKTPLRRATPIKKRPATKKKKPQTYYRNRCDELWSKIIRSKGRCEMAGAGGRGCSNVLNACHIKSRFNAKTRHDLRNGICGCSSHHRWGHLNPADFYLWVTVSRPGDLEYLCEKAREPGKVRYDELLPGLTAMWERLQGVE